MDGYTAGHFRLVSELIFISLKYYMVGYTAADLWVVPNNLPGIVKSPLDQFEIRNLLSLDAPILANLRISL